MVERRGKHRRLRQRLVRALLLTGTLLALVTPATASTAPDRVPAVYRRVASTIAPGIERLTLTRRDPAEVVNVARIARGAPYDLRAVTGKDGIGDGLERTSAICRRVGCAVAVNGDFWKPGTDVPIGGVVSEGRLLRNPSSDHAQVTLTREGDLRTGPFEIRASLVPDDLKPLSITGLGRLPRADELVLFTPAFGRHTATKKGTMELVLRAVRPAGAVALSKTTIVRTAKHASPAGNAPIPADGAVLSGRGKGDKAIRDLLKRVRAGATSAEALLRLDPSIGAVESIGGSPVLVRGGRPIPPSDPTSFVTGRHPRTLIGWTAQRDVLLVTVDGRQPGHSEGMTLAEAARLMVNLGATDAVNLDGGGSTTFVSKGVVRNRPSDRAVRSARGTKLVQQASRGQNVLGNVERPVAIALAVVPKDPGVAVAASDAMAHLPLPQSIEAAVPQATDLASIPDAALPALIPATADDDRWLQVIAIVVAALAVAVSAAWGGYSAARRRPGA